MSVMPYDRKAAAKLAMEAYADALEKATKGVFFGDLDERDVAMEAMEAAVAAVEPVIREAAEARVREMTSALEGVVRVADRRTVEFDRARAALHLPEASTPT